MRVKMPFYQYAPATQMPTPGAMQYGFESEMLAMRPAIGPAIAARVMFRSIASNFPAQAGQAYQAACMNWFTGLGGLSQGQNVLQPLSNPYAGS
jgi:hypothetical protein